MPTFISLKGKQYPAKEEVSLTNESDKDIVSKYVFGTKKEGVAVPGEHFIYRGPDREAIKMLNEAGAEYLGGDFRKDPEFLQSVRNQNFNNTDEYLKHIDYDEEADEKKFKEKVELVKAHDMPRVAKELRIMGGGQDRSGNKDNDMIGGFGDERERKPAELKKETTVEKK